MTRSDEFSFPVPASLATGRGLSLVTEIEFVWIVSPNSITFTTTPCLESSNSSVSETEQERQKCHAGPAWSGLHVGGRRRLQGREIKVSCVECRFTSESNLHSLPDRFSSHTDALTRHLCYTYQYFTKDTLSHCVPSGRLFSNWVLNQARKESRRSEIIALHPR
jgi:hypothetical protein